MSSFQLQNSDVLARLKPFGISFEKSLTDLIKGIRAQSKESGESLQEFLANSIRECKDELITTDLETKAMAVLKLAYLEMYGYDMSWCNFHILEVMSAPKFQHKRIGYLAAMQSFKAEQDLLVLATNQFKKDLNSHNHIEIGLALSGIATIVSPSLAQDIVDDVVSKLNHSKPYIRKKAVLVLFKIFLQYPESWKSALPRVVDRLDDTDISVVSATITVVCEISKKNPTAFIGYLPKFFTILEDTSNNWLIIRILKLFQSLSKIEPRMKKRIMPSILSLMTKTDATSLKYECINCIVDGGMISSESTRDKEIAKSCLEHLLKFFSYQDSNLRFVGLLALIKILHVYPSFIHKLSEVAPVINMCIQDDDLIIKRKALEICHYLVNEDNIADLVKTLLLQILPEKSSASCPQSFKLEIASKILEITSADNYANIPNFKWYVIALKELIHLTILAESSQVVDDGNAALSEGISRVISSKLGNQFKILVMKVPSIRPFVVSKVVLAYTNNLRLLHTCPDFVKDLYWIMGEYVDDYGHVGTEEDDELDQTESLGQKVTLFNMLVNKHIGSESATELIFPIAKALSQSCHTDLIISAIDALIKLYSSIICDYQSLYARDQQLSYGKYCQLVYFLTKLIQFLEIWEAHSSYEIQESCASWLEYLKLCHDSLNTEHLGGVKRLRREEEYYYQQISEKSLRERESEMTSDQGSRSENEDGDDSDDSDDGDDSDNSDNSNVSYTNDSLKQPSSHSNENSVDLEAKPEEIEFDFKQFPTLLTEVLPSFFKSYSLNPISAFAQSRIPVPEDLDLDTVIHNPPAFVFEQDESFTIFDSSEESDDQSPEETTSQNTSAKYRFEKFKDDPYYLTSFSKKKSTKTKSRIIDLEGELKGRGSEYSSEAPSLIDLSESQAIKGKRSRKVKKEKVLVLAEDTLGLEAETLRVEPKYTEKNQKRNKLIIDTLNLESLNMDSSGPESEISSKAYEYDIDLSQLRTQLADESMKKAEKEQRRLRRKKEKHEESQKQVETQKVHAREELSEVGDMKVNQASLPADDVTNHVITDMIITVPQKSKKKKKRALIIE